MCKSILIVEDEAVLRQSLAELLTDEGYQVHQAGDGKEAYDLILNQVPGIVLYASEALDITQILIDRFNSGTAVEETPSE